jgi:hypothetical protein
LNKKSSAFVFIPFGRCGDSILIGVFGLSLKKWLRRETSLEYGVAGLYEKGSS